MATNHVHGQGESDGRIHEAIHERLSQGHLDVSDLDLEVKGGVVLLEGSVESQEDRDHVERLVSGITGVERVDNQLVVKSHNHSYDELLDAQKQDQQRHRTR